MNDPLVDVWFDVPQLQHIHKALAYYYKHADHPQQLLDTMQHVEHVLARYESVTGDQSAAS